MKQLLPLSLSLLPTRPLSYIFLTTYSSALLMLLLLLLFVVFGDLCFIDILLNVQICGIILCVRVCVCVSVCVQSCMGGPLYLCGIWANFLWHYSYFAFVRILNKKYIRLYQPSTELS